MKTTIVTPTGVGTTSSSRRIAYSVMRLPVPAARRSAKPARHSCARPRHVLLLHLSPRGLQVHGVVLYTLPRPAVRQAFQYHGVSWTLDWWPCDRYSTAPRTFGWSPVYEGACGIGT